jgi:hypothetical protein
MTIGVFTTEGDVGLDIVEFSLNGPILVVAFN